MAKAEIARINTRKEEAGNTARQLGHVLGEWWETVTPNELAAQCIKPGCRAIVQLGTSRDGIITITGVSIGRPLPNYCQGLAMTVQEVKDALGAGGYRPGAWG